MEKYIYLFYTFIRVVILKHIKYNAANIYIIGHYIPSVSIMDLVSHTTYVVCVNFIQKWREGVTV